MEDSDLCVSRQAENRIKDREEKCRRGRRSATSDAGDEESAHVPYLHKPRSDWQMELVEKRQREGDHRENRVEVEAMMCEHLRVPSTEGRNLSEIREGRCWKIC
jgi:hypothetical protein